MSPDPTPVALRTHLARLLDWNEAHLELQGAFEGIPPELRGRQPEGLPYSPWQLLEHLRRAQRDLLEFCRDPDYEHPDWPGDFWPADPAPPDADAWEASLRAVHDDLAALKEHVADPAVDLFALVPSGTERQTQLRSILLVADHNAYHVGQLVVVRRLLGVWPPA